MFLKEESNVNRGILRNLNESDNYDKIRSKIEAHDFGGRYHFSDDGSVISNREIVDMFYEDGGGEAINFPDGMLPDEEQEAFVNELKSFLDNEIDFDGTIWY